MKSFSRSLFVTAAVAALLSTGAVSAGAETRYCLGERATIVGTAGADDLNGTDGPDVIVGAEGDDEIAARGGKDLVCGNEGGDDLIGGDGDDKLAGGVGPDTLAGRAGSDLLDGGDGTEDSAKFRVATQGVTASLTSGVASGEGSDTLADVEQLWGSDYADFLTGDANQDGNVLVGASGDDIINGAGAADRVAGGRGDDSLAGGPGEDVLDHQFLSGPGPITVDFPSTTVTGMGTDSISGFEATNDTPADDTFIGDTVARNFILLAGGDDTVTASGGDDLIEGGPGDDNLNGGEGTDFLSFLNSTAGVTVDLAAATASGQGTDSVAGFENVFGSPQGDTIVANDGPNLLIARGGDDTISGLAGNDFIDGGDGVDIADGGLDSDTCQEAETVINCE